MIGWCSGTGVGGLRTWVPISLEMSGLGLTCDKRVLMVGGSCGLNLKSLPQGSCVKTFKWLEGSRSLVQWGMPLRTEEQFFLPQAACEWTQGNRFSFVCSLPQCTPRVSGWLLGHYLIIY